MSKTDYQALQNWYHSILFPDHGTHLHSTHYNDHGFMRAHMV